MSKNTDYPVTPAVRFLRTHQIDFEPYIYVYEEHGGTGQFAELFGVDEHQVVVVMHGDKQISTRNLARDLGMKHIEPADPKQANKWTGYLVGGTTPFGMKTRLPVYVEKSIWDLEKVYINGGKRGFIIGVNPQALRALNPQDVQVAV